MKIKMITPTGQIMTRIPERDVANHKSNGWKMLDEEKTSSVKKEVKSKSKSVKKDESQVEADLTPNEGEEQWQE